MSGQGPLQSAADIEERAAAFLMERQDQRNWTEENQQVLDAWLVESIAHQVAYFRLEAVLGRTERLRALRSASHRPGSIWPAVFKAAVAFSIVVAISAEATSYLLQPRATTYQTSVGNREILSLNDGSQVELNTDSSLRIAQDITQRRAWLDKGEAYFQIKHDTHHPFVVVAGNISVIDLGTKFVLRKFSDRLEVMLVEGGARVESTAHRARTAILKPGDVAVARTDSITVARRSQQELVDALGWRRGVLTFRYTTLAEAAAEFNRYNKTKIVVADPLVARLTIYGAFASNDVAAFTDAAQAYFKLHIENSDGQVVLSR